jgi:GT2 family glycosyltransferase/glycosyltransferase involved in cell wall biosynthesis
MNPGSVMTADLDDGVVCREARTAGDGADRGFCSSPTAARAENRSRMSEMHQQADPTPPGSPSVSIVIVTFRSARLLPDLFRSLPGAMTGVAQYEVLIVDNASGDETLDVARELAPNARVIALDSNGGYAAGVNAGIQAARACDAVLVLNPDIRLGAGSGAALLNRVRQPGVGIAVPRIVGEDGVLQHSLHRAPSVLRAWGEAVIGGRRAGRIALLGESIVDAHAYARPTSAAWASGAAMMVSTACIRAVGEWNEAFFLYSEETEFCLRAGDAGFRTQLEPAAEVVHIGGEMTTSPRLWAMQAWNRVRLYGSRHGGIATALFRAGVVVNEALRAARGSHVHRAGLASVLSVGARPPEVRAELPPSPRPVPPADYVCFSGQDFWYHNRAHSDIQLMRNVAASRRVLFVNSIGMRMPLPGRSTQAFRRIWRKAKSMAKLVRTPIAELPDFHVMTPLMLPLYGSAIARRLNAALVRTQVRIVSWALGMKCPVYMVTIPTAWEVVRPMERRCLIYNRSDLHSSFPEADKKLIEGYESQLLQHSDFVCYVSRALMQQEQALTGGRAVFIDHGVDLHHFRALPPEEHPADIRDLPRPRIGFFGGLDDYIIDFDLLERIAVEFPEASLVLIGDATCSMERFAKYPNVHWLGFQPYEKMPGYGSGFDVALMPWLDNDWIRHSNPIKLKEYLALGLPAVTIDFPEAHYYADHLAIARGADAFIAEIRRLLSSPPDRDVLRAAVLKKSWAHRAALLTELCEGRMQPADVEKN